MQTSAPFSVQLGTVLGGDFTILRPLSQGGMGAVYVARQNSTGAERAVKLMHPEIAQDKRFRQRFEQEARVGYLIKSDHVVHVVAAGVDETSGMPWLAMELLEGTDLASFLRERTRLSLGETAVICAQLGHALAAAHSVGIVHRDLKPENVFLTPGRVAGMPFVVKVLDFGIAKVVSATATATMALGTPLYMAPEQASRESEVGPDTDVWGFALMVFHLLTGRSFWRAGDESGTAVELWREVLVDEIPPASVRASQFGLEGYLPAGFDNWFARCVARDRTTRYRDANIASFALAQILAPWAPISHAPSSPIASPRPPSNAPFPTTAPHPIQELAKAMHDSGVTVRTPTAAARLTPTDFGRPTPLDQSSPPPGRAITTARLTFREPGEKVVVHARRGESILTASLEHGVPHYHACNGNARCTTCRVLVLDGEGNLSPRNDAERRVASERRWPENIRLSCQARVLGDATARRLVVDSEDEGLVHNERQVLVAEREMVVLKVSLRDYAEFADKNLAFDAVHTLHRFLRHASEPVTANHGIIERYTSSGLIALFGSKPDRSLNDACDDALRAALRIVARGRRFNQHVQRHYGTEMAIGIVVDAGPVILAELGPREKTQLTALGKPIDNVDQLDLIARSAGITVAATNAVIEPIRSELSLGRELSDPTPLTEVLDFTRPDTVVLVQTSFERAAARGDQLVELFYDRLFAQHPSVEPLFDGVDMRAQREMLLKVLATAVRGLEDLPALVPTLESLGRRHVGYGAKTSHYKAVGEALLWSLEQVLGEHFTPETHLAWLEIYGIVARTMLDGARKAEAASA
ncbi:MAG: protein kinase [Polyangiaceae bacterium]